MNELSVDPVLRRSILFPMGGKIVIGASLVLAALVLRPAAAEEPRTFGLQSGAALQASGLLDYILPRFALKTGRRVDPNAAPDVVFAAGQGTPVTMRGDRIFGISLKTGNDAAARFVDWLLSDIGQNTIAAYVPETGAGFGRVTVKTEQAAVMFEGDARAGRTVASTHCTRCHKIAPEDRSSIGSTPSFMAMKALDDWADRFAQFYLLNPHPSFMQIAEMTEPFDVRRPPSLVPVELTVDELNALLAYVQTVPAADLGDEIRHQ